jgi:hypothetical protein
MTANGVQPDAFTQPPAEPGGPRASPALRQEVKFFQQVLDLFQVFTARKVTRKSAYQFSLSMMRAYLSKL